MKKCLSLLIGIVSFFGINTVKADTLVVNYENYDFDKKITFYNQYKDLFDTLQKKWQTDYSSTYPYYFIDFRTHGIMPNDPRSGKDFLLLGAFKTNNTMWQTDYLMSSSSEYIYIEMELDTRDINTGEGYVPLIFDYNNKFNVLYHNGLIYNNIPSSWTHVGYGNMKSDFEKIKFSSFSSSVHNFSFNEFEIKDGDIFPSHLTLYNKTYKPNGTDYIEINLNNYAYVALSLKDYTKEIKNSYSEYSNLYVKGKLCATPVYNYGQTEKKDIVSGSKNQACSQYYDNFTISRFYILPNDIKNHAIYYLKAYDTTKDNIVKVDPNYFNISYITEEDKDNPKVTINGKEYPTLAYDSLSDTATKSEDEGYVSGLSCAVGDMNCYIENNPSNLFDNLFDKPLEKLKQIWSAITQIFTLIGSFIMLLPAELQAFLYISLGIALVLGIIKIIL